MGCQASQPIYPMGIDPRLMSYSSSANKTIDSKTFKIPLTEREVFNITKSWKAISKNMTNTGVNMFLKMFETNEDMKIMFEQFRTVDNVADLWTSRALENHAVLVMNALDDAITNMDDEQYVIEMLLATGKSHKRFENFNANIFWNIEEPFLVSIKETLGNRMNTHLEQIYAKAIRFVLIILVTGFEHKEGKSGSGISSPSNMSSAYSH